MPPPQIMAIRKSLERLEELQDFQRMQETFGQKQPLLNFSSPKISKPKSAGFGSSQPRPKKISLGENSLERLCIARF